MPTIRNSWPLHAVAGLLGLLLASPVCVAATSLDDILSSLESGGILSNRDQAVRGGVEGILQAIDAGASLAPLTVAGESNKTGQAIRAVEMWPEDIAYLKLTTLSTGCGEDVVTHLMALKDKAGIVFDLRGAGGDDLDAVSLLAGIGHQSGDPLLVLTDNRGQVLATNTVTRGLTLGVPLMVLIDSGTRGASEALAAVWRGCSGVMLIGSATRGEACLRSEVTLPGGLKVLVASRRFVPVRGDPFAGRGVQPTVEVLPGNVLAPEPGGILSADSARPARPLSRKSEQDRDLMQRVAGDEVLRRATDILLGLRVVNNYGQQ